MNKQIEALKMAKAELGKAQIEKYDYDRAGVIIAIERALAEAEKQEPTWIVNDTAGTKLRKYTNPAPSWQSLSDNEIELIELYRKWKKEKNT